MIETRSYATRKIKSLEDYSIHNIAIPNIPLPSIELQPTDNNDGSTISIQSISNLKQ